MAVYRVNPSSNVSDSGTCISCLSFSSFKFDCSFLEETQIPQDFENQGEGMKHEKWRLGEKEQGEKQPSMGEEEGGLRRGFRV